LEGDAYVAELFRHVFNREPEAGEFAEYAEALKSRRMTKSEILLEMLQSDEGRRSGVRVLGLEVHLPAGGMPGAIYGG